MLFILFWIPVLIIAIAALAAQVSVRMSTLGITEAGIEIRNYPQAPKTVPLDRVAQFEATPRAGNFSSLRPRTGVLVLTTGERLPVRSLTVPGVATGVEALNDHVASLRHRD